MYFSLSLDYSHYTTWTIEHCATTAQWQVWINSCDIILIGLRDYQDSKADVILKYTADEARNLKTYGELPESGG